MIVVHHLGVSQSDRVLWVCEELGLPYQMVKYDRDPIMRSGPTAYKKLDFYGTAPVIQDGDLTMGESGAIVEYICRKYANDRLFVGSSAPNFAAFLFWFHFANASFMAGGMMALGGGISGDDTSERARGLRYRYDRAFDLAEQRLGEAPYFAGAEFTAADIMMAFPLTVMRLFLPRDLSKSPNTLAYLQRIGARPAYRRAMQKGDPDMELKLT